MRLWKVRGLLENMMNHDVRILATQFQPPLRLVGHGFINATFNFPFLFSSSAQLSTRSGALEILGEPDCIIHSNISVPVLKYHATVVKLRASFDGHIDLGLHGPFMSAAVVFCVKQALTSGLRTQYTSVISALINAEKRAVNGLLISPVVLIAWAVAFSYLYGRTFGLPHSKQTCGLSWYSSRL